MSDWLAILAAASAVLGAAAAPNAPVRFALWLAGSVVSSAWLAAALEAVLPAEHHALYRPLLVAVTGSVVAWALGRGFAADHLRLMPYVILLAAGTSALLLADTSSITSLLRSSLLAGASCGLFVVAGAARRTYDLPHQLLGICVLLLALSALATIA